MSKYLYFIPIIFQALKQPNRKEALRQVFEKIEKLGQEQEYREGHRQFLWFMDEVVRQKEISENRPDLLGPEIIRELILELATGAFEGDQDERDAAIEMLRSRPEWFNEYERLIADFEAPIEQIRTKIIVEKDGRHFGEIALEQIPGSGSIGKIVPGEYEIKLETGWMLWEGDLTEEDLLWTKAFPGRALDLAADTGETKKRPSREESLLGGEIIVRVFPGIESGKIEIEARLSKGA